MKKRNPEVDKYISEAAPFARPILKKIRSLFHKAHPEITETMKWRFPHFEYKGVLASMAAFKEHASFGFWKGRLFDDPQGWFANVGLTSMNHRKLKDVAELPSDKILMSFIHQAIELNEKNVKVARPKRRSGPVEAPDDLLAALKKNKKARQTFENFSPSQKREYVEWITGAKREETRSKRLATAIEWMAEGKPHNWRYMK